MSNSNTSLTYRDAGVDIDAGDSLVDRIKPIASKTMREGVMSNIGGFGALFEVPKRYKNPVLVSGTDGVGTKLRLAFEWNCHDTVGIDLVAMSVNDILVQGAEPLFFLDYFACGKLDVEIAASVIAGIGAGCKMSNCALIGGETAEMPSMYPDNEYDLAGFAVGAVEKDGIINGEHISVGDVVLGLASSGAHSNGYSLIRKIIERTGMRADSAFGSDASKPFSKYVMEPTRIYVLNVLNVLGTFGNAIKGMAHITGGGLLENVPRMLQKGLCASIDKTTWKQPELFTWLRESGNVAEQEMFRVFNCGIGFVMVVNPSQAAAVKAALTALGETVYTLGEIVAQKEGGAQTIVV